MKRGPPSGIVTGAEGLEASLQALEARPTTVRPVLISNSTVSGPFQGSHILQVWTQRDLGACHNPPAGPSADQSSGTHSCWHASIGGIYEDQAKKIFGTISRVTVSSPTSVLEQ